MMRHLRYRPRPARGMDVVGSLLGMVALFIVVGVALDMLYKSSEERNHETVARQANQWARAARAYIADNHSQLLATAPATISRDALVNGGYLNSGEPATNLYLQTWTVAVRRASASPQRLEAVLLSRGGDVLDYKTLRYISAAIDDAGGFVYTGSMPEGCTSSATVVNGAACSWTLNLAGFGVNTTSGHLAVNLGADLPGNTTSGADYLHRFSAPGHPEYNQMQTDLDMNRKNINRTGNLLVSSDGRDNDNHGDSGSAGFVGWTTGGSGTATDATSLNAGLYFSTSASDSSDKESTWIKTTDNTSLEVKGKLRASAVRGERLLQSDGYLLPGRTVTEGSACDPASLGISDLLADTTGLVARDSSGATLSCQSGAWKKSGAVNVTFSRNVSSGKSENIGIHQYCALSQTRFDYNNYRSCILTRNANSSWVLSAPKVGNGQADCVAVCF